MRSEVNLKELVLCFYFYLDSRDQTQVARLVHTKWPPTMGKYPTHYVLFLSNLDIWFLTFDIRNLRLREERGPFQP